MAAFPDLAPVRREWEFPTFPTIDYEGIGGNTISFEFGDTPTDQPLELVFELLSETEMQQIRDHYLGQQSVHPFNLSPLAANAGYVATTGIFSTDTLWLYAEEPEEEPRNFGLYDATISLRSVRP